MCSTTSSAPSRAALSTRGAPTTLSRTVTRMLHSSCTHTDTCMSTYQTLKNVHSAAVAARGSVYLAGALGWQVRTTKHSMMMVAETLTHSALAHATLFFIKQHSNDRDREREREREREPRTATGLNPQHHSPQIYWIRYTDTTIVSSAPTAHVRPESEDEERDASCTPHAHTGAVITATCLCVPVPDSTQTTDLVHRPCFGTLSRHARRRARTYTPCTTAKRGEARSGDTTVDLPVHAYQPRQLPALGRECQGCTDMHTGRASDNVSKWESASELQRGSVHNSKRVSCHETPAEAPPKRATSWMTVPTGIDSACSQTRHTWHNCRAQNVLACNLTCTHPMPRSHDARAQALPYLVPSLLHIYIYIHTHTHTHTHIYIYIYIYIYIHIYIHTYIYKYSINLKYICARRPCLT